MPITNANQNIRSDDPAWVLLSEFSFSDFLSDHGRRDQPAVEHLFQTVQALGISSECMAEIAGTLAGSAREVLLSTKQGRLEFRGWIRIFCQKKMIDDAKSAQTVRLVYIEQGKKQNGILSDSRAYTMGGWGYFIIERGADLPPVPSAIPQTHIDLYLYKEGEKHG